MSQERAPGLQIDILTVFPEYLAPLELSLIGRARSDGLLKITVHDVRDQATDRHRTVDDTPYGGGPGMVMMAEPLAKAIAAARQRQKSTGVARPRVIHLTPQGRLLNHEVVMELAGRQGLVLLAGRYEGVDERLMHEIDDEISIGDYVLSGGELAAMVLIDCIVRQLPGVLGDAESASQDSFVNGLLDCPHYTRPEDYAGQKVPPVLLSGNHADIGRWRLKQALGRTWQRRPDLLAKRVLSDEERRLLEEFKQELSGV